MPTGAAGWTRRRPFVVWGHPFEMLEVVVKAAMWSFLALIVLLVGGLVTLWVLQNADQTVLLRLDLGSGLGLAWQTAEPVPATTLALAAFFVGIVTGGLLAGASRLLSGTDAHASDF